MGLAIRFSLQLWVSPRTHDPLVVGRIAGKTEKQTPILEVPSYLPELFGNFKAF